MSKCDVWFNAGLLLEISYRIIFRGKSYDWFSLLLCESEESLFLYLVAFTLIDDWAGSQKSEDILTLKIKLIL